MQRRCILNNFSFLLKSIASAAISRVGRDGNGQVVDVVAAANTLGILVPQPTFLHAAHAARTVNGRVRVSLMFGELLVLHGVSPFFVVEKCNKYIKKDSYPKIGITV